MAGIFARSLKQQLDIDKERAKEKDREMYEFHKDEILCAEIAGLCHDLGINRKILVVILLTT